MIRAVTRASPALLPEARDLLSAFGFVSLDEDIVDAAMNEPDPKPRSLDAIHQATARVLRPDLTGLVTYHDRLTIAGGDAGLTIISPRG